MKTEIKITPLFVEIMIWYKWSIEDHPSVKAGANDAIGIMETLIKLGIAWKTENTIDEPNRYRRYGVHQDALDVYFDEIEKIPLPKMKWACETIKKGGEND